MGSATSFGSGLGGPCVTGCRPCQGSPREEHARFQVTRSYRARTVKRTSSIRLTLADDGEPGLELMNSTEEWTARAKEEIDFHTDSGSTFGHFNVAGDGNCKTNKKQTMTSFKDLSKSNCKLQDTWSSTSGQSGESGDIEEHSDLVSPHGTITKDIHHESHYRHSIPNVIRLDTQTTVTDEEDLDEMEQQMTEQMNVLLEKQSTDAYGKRQSNLYRMDSTSPTMWEEERLDLMDEDIHKEMDILAQRNSIKLDD